MNTSYRTGLEGYCKSATNTLGLPARRKEWLRFCIDILPDRTIEKLSRTWTLSNTRNGRGSRYSIFEDCWLSEDYNTYLEEAERRHTSEREEGEAPYLTIQEGSSYERDLLNAKDEEECKELAAQQCASDAIDTCVSNIIRIASDDDKENAPSITSLLWGKDAVVSFYEQIIPAIESGFEAERYRAADIRQFTLNICDLLASTCGALNSKQNTDYEVVRPLITALIAGLVYGPSHPIAISQEKNATSQYYSSHGTQEVEGASIRVTQVFDDELVYTGYSQMLRPNQAIFFGRSPKIDDFEDACDKHLNKETLQVLSEYETVLFPIGESHDAVGNVHGVLMCENDIWRFYDFESSNGTTLQSNDSITSVTGVMEILPGDLVRLGAPQNARDANVYWSAAAMYITKHVERERELY